MRRASCFILTVLFATGLFLLGMNGCGGAIQHNTILAGKFQHIVIIFQENRSPENLFHDPVLIKAGADIASSGKNSAWQTIPLTLSPLGGLES